ncbi:MAG: aerobic carbon-monoxide dehydrogenase large subunit [Thermoleophilaceae bacterium]|nr:aerobic carbon-monoxide dehydrogenase large subunit [Thermoleophilaceae bacterium]
MSGIATIGQSAPRLEDARLVRAAGRFVDDVDLPGQLWMRVVRADVAHARIRGIDTEAARSAPGVVDVVTHADVARFGAIPLRLDFGIDLEPYLQQVLAGDRVRYVGEPVAVVVATGAYAADDAAELVELDYEELPAVVDAIEALDAGATSLWDDHGNEAATLTKRFGPVDEAFAQADRVVSAKLRVGRHTGMPLETRGLVADWDAGRRELTVWGAALVTHYHRRVLSRLLSVPVNRIHMRGTDVGGNFGVRGDFFPEDLLVPFMAMRTGRPVKWTEDRAEHLVATNHAREQVHHIEAAFDSGGRLLALRDEIWHDKGAYIRPTGVVVSEISVGMLPWPYRVPAYEGTIHVVTTNKTPVGPYRAPGRFEGTFAREQLLTIAAHELGMDPVELRLMNLLTTAELPHEPDHSIGGEPFVLNSGDFTGLLEKAVAASGFDDWRSEAEALRADGKLVGTGVGYFMDKSGLGVYETAGVDVDIDGSVRVLIGGSSSGQGIETVMGQIVSETLGVAMDKIHVIHGDTDLIPDGVGSWSSRSTVIGGSATLMAAQETAEKARRIAADVLEAELGDVVLEDGRAFVAGSPDHALTLAQIATAADTFSNTQRGEAPGLGARSVYVDPAMNYPYGVGLGQVEIDPETGSVRLLRYFVAYEIGRAINPMLVKGQIAGGAAQGLGGALMEELTYDANGQPTATSFIDYMLPTASEMPDVGVLICEDAPTPTNPLGAKGAGESGIMPVGAVVAGAIDDALGMPGVADRLPAHPERVRDWIALARDRKENAWAEG